MRTVITLPMKKNRELPVKFQHCDIRYPENLVELLIKEFTKPGDNVIDIFAGYGTTLLVAEDLDRKPIGIELDTERFEYTKSVLKNSEYFFNGNSMNLDKLNLPKIDFALSSPTYMNEFEIENPLTGFTDKGTYQDYLDFLQKIYQKLKKIMKKNSFIVIEVSNLKNNGKITTLAWDIAKKIAEVFDFQGEIVVHWEANDSKSDFSYGYGYDHSYCLIFQNK